MAREARRGCTGFVEFKQVLLRAAARANSWIADFGRAWYNGRMNVFCERFQLVFDGRASERLAEVVERRMDVARRASSREETL